MALSWSKTTKHRDKLVIWDLPVIKRNTENPWELLREYAGNNDTVLEVGAGEASYRKHFPKTLKYKTMDIDPEVKVDYRSLRGIKEKFDSVWMLNLVEHLTIAQLEGYAEDIKKILKPGGRVIIWTHNVYALPDITHYDFSHVQHYPVGDLFGILNNHGYELERAYRVLDNRGLRKLRNPFKRLICGILGVDYAWGLLLVVKKE